MTMKTEEEKHENDADDVGFKFGNSGLNQRCKDVFANLDALEARHKAFETKRAHDDWRRDEQLLTQQAIDDEPSGSEKPHSRRPVSDYHSRPRNTSADNRRPDREFRVPMPPRGRGRGQWRGRGRGVPDYKVHPERWTTYSLEDVDTSDASNKQAAFAFLNERKKLRETEQKETAVDLEENACSAGKITFTRRNKRETKAGNVAGQSVPREKQEGTVGRFEEGEEEEEGKSDDSEMKNPLKRQADGDLSECSASSRIKLDINDVTCGKSEEVGAECDSVQKPQFKSRGKAKKAFRSRQRTDDDDDNDS
ncbi:TSSC4-like protein [Mya arenaria]|uniref:U5 small nuclear ribonucleoprotein TSSC4 n=1 Tax=Mya arenaria TaxID=6604 RepID=A0ABY7E1B3_MYAAR|nr:protein TSSC4-like [Mya arenaria]XP_052801471.1 protein TSSC4-like [Mya arenaria]WAR02296.1 TSSC4-like protein [Mya arenaria]